MTDESKTVNPISKAVTNYQYEEKINNEKRRIFLLKPMYLEEMMAYKEGSTQYVNESLKRGENSRLYN